MNKTLWHEIKSQMQKTPSSILEEGEQRITYAQAILLVEALADTLTGNRYAILCEHELNSALAVLACFAAGKTAVPISMRYGQMHCEKILAQIQPDYLLTDDIGELFAVKFDGEIPSDAPAPALIMCTSGTSGNPKGVMLSEENLLINLSDIGSYFRLSSKDRILIARPLYHCAVLTGEFLLALTHGANLVFDSSGFDPAHLIKILILKQITVFCGTPTLLTLTAKMLKERKNELSLKKIAVSGECMTDFAAQIITSGFPNAEIYHVYGLTEASPRVAYLPPHLFQAHAKSVGFLLPSLCGKIVDCDGHSLPAGEVGELYISGPSVMMGYHNNKEETERVLTDGWLHTGDLAFTDENGLLTVMGRKDDLIIYAGMNIYPKEIENALKSDSRVREVLAYGIPDKLCGEKIGVKIAGDFPNQKEIERLCMKALPAYMRPSVIEWMEALTKNASGKLIRSRPDRQK